MKKLFALLLSLCLLCSVALAEDPELNWSDVSDENKALGELMQLSLPDMPGIIFWVPSVMAAADVSSLGDTAPAAAFLTEDNAYSLSVYTLEVSSLEDYLTEQVNNGTEISNITINGITAVACENSNLNFEGIIIKMTDTTLLYFACTPKDGDDTWDDVKGIIFSSIQVAQ